MTSKFEQLIEFVINDEEAKAKELFHDIVVEKSREIYESLMDDEDEQVEEGYGGDASDDLIDDVETEEEGMSEGEEDGLGGEEEEFDADDSDEEMEFGSDDGMAGEEELEDRVVDLEDKLDELMAEFEAMMGGESAEAEDEFGPEDGGDSLEMDDTEEMSPEMGMMEAVSLSAAPKPVTTEPAGTGTKSNVAANSGARGMAASPVKMTGDTAQGRPAPTAGALIGNVQNSVGGKKSMSAATKPVSTQAAGVNTKSPVSKA
jgi:hypothetical protein